jgi:competence protein ComEC
LVGHSFHQLPLYSVPANAVLIPLVGLVALPLGLAAAGLSLVWTQAGEALFTLASWPAEGAVLASHWLAGLPGGVIYLAGPNLATVLLLYAGAASAWLLRGKARRAAVGLAAAGALACIVWQIIPVAPDGKLKAWVLDVGQGSAAVLRTPGGKVMLVDGGGLPGQSFDTGARVVAPFLWWAGWSRPWIIAGSHREQDHVGGLCFVLRHLGAHQLWVNGGPNGRRAFDRLWNQAQAGGTPIKGPADLPRDAELAGARVRLFWPPPDGAPDRHDENDRSLWLGVGLGDTWIWLPGDAGPSVERLVAPCLPAGGEHVLVAPHHGSGGGLTPELMRRIKPAWVIISVGCHNRHHLPHPDTVARARAAGCRVLSTAQWGALELVSDGAHWSVKPWLGEARDCPRRP